MVEELRHMFERAQRQPEDVQRRIAERVREELEEDEADEGEGSPELFARLEESRRQIAAGEYATLEDLDQHRRERP